jgi:hypothetical protein
MKATYVAVAFLAVGLATGCSVVGLSPEQEEEAYLLRVAQAEAPWLAAIDRFDRTLSGSYSTRNAFLRGLKNAGLAEGAKDSHAAAGQLTAPDSLAADHEAWLEFRRSVDVLAPDLEQATAIGDVVTVLAARRALGEAEAEFLLAVSRNFCLHLAAVDPAEDCAPDDSLPGGEYGTAAYETLREYAIRVGPLFLTSSTLDQSQRTEYLAGVQPEIEVLLRDTGERLRRLTPPDEFAVDHEALLSYFDAQYQTAAAITVANAAGDDQGIVELYAESAQLFETLQQSLSEAVRPIVNPAF